MLPDVDAREVARLARAMTWKFAVCGVRYAGAKAGIRFEGGDRDAVLAAYRRALTPFRDVFLTGPDMGTRPSDFVTPDLVEDLPLWAQSHEGLGMDDLATGHGVKAAAEAALAHLGRGLEGATVAIEGFGKVGAGTARACARAGARVVAISTVHGLVADPAGLDVEQLLELRGRFGDRFVENAALEARPREELFGLEVDVLVPGARPDSITRKVAERVRCAVVSPGANIPYAPASVETLHRRGVVAIPDFISNSGGVHLYESVEQDDEPGAALAKIEELVAETVTSTLAAAEAEGVTPLEAALRDVRAYLAAETGAADKVLGRPRRRLAGDLVQHPLPAREEALQLLAGRAVRGNRVGIAPVLRELALDAGDERLLLLDLALEKLERLLFAATPSAAAASAPSSAWAPEAVPRAPPVRAGDRPSRRRRRAPSRPRPQRSGARPRREARGRAKRADTVPGKASSAASSASRLSRSRWFVGFVEDEEVRARGDEDGEREAPPLAAGERRDGLLVRLPAGEEEAAEERLRARPRQPGHRLHAVEDAAALVQMHLLLREVAELDAVAELEVAGDDPLEERGLCRCRSGRRTRRARPARARARRRGAARGPPTPTSACSISRTVRPLRFGSPKSNPSRFERRGEEVVLGPRRPSAPSPGARSASASPAPACAFDFL